jgi:hypothetical protein
MGKKIKLISIGAAVMLLALTAQSVVAEGEIPESLKKDLYQFQDDYATELKEFRDYVASLNGSAPPANLPAEISATMATLANAMEAILEPYIVQSVGPGVLNYWRSSQSGHPDNPWAMPRWFYNGYCISLNLFWSLVVWFFVVFADGGPYDWDAADLAIFLMACPGVHISGDICIKLTQIFAVHWTEFFDWLSEMDNWGTYGIAWYFFIPVGHLVILSLYEQYGQPLNFAPSWKHPEFTWIDVA